MAGVRANLGRETKVLGTQTRQAKVTHPGGRHRTPVNNNNSNNSISRNSSSTSNLSNNLSNNPSNSNSNRNSNSSSIGRSTSSSKG
jgi:hypothetical protein